MTYTIIYLIVALIILGIILGFDYVDSGDSNTVTPIVIFIIFVSLVWPITLLIWIPYKITRKIKEKYEQKTTSQSIKE